MNSKPPLSCSSIHIAPFLDLDYRILFNEGSHNGLFYKVNLQKLNKILNNEIIDVFNFSKVKNNKQLHYIVIMNETIYFTFLLPSRERIDCFKKSIDSIINNASKEYKFEILIACDIDDKDNTHIKKNFMEIISNEKKYLLYKIIETERYGYSKLHNYYNKLSEISKGDILWLWNDDCTILTKNWDKLFYQHHVMNKHPYHFYNPGGAGFWFPAISKTTYNKIGHFSLSPHNDTYIECIAKKINMVVSVNDVIVKHSTPQDNLTNENNKIKEITSPNFHKIDIKYVNSTIERLKKYLSQVKN